MKTEREVLVVGGGIAGLTAALALADAGHDVELLESATEAGGHCTAERVDGYLLARGPQAFPGSSLHVLRLAERVGLLGHVQPARAASRRFLWLRDRLVEMPSGPLSFLTSPFLSLAGKLQLLTEPLRGRPARRDDDESVAAFFERRIGREAARLLGGTFVSGVYAGDPDRLEARSAFPRLARWEAESGSLLRGAMGERRRLSDADRALRRRGTWSLPGGLAELAAACARALGDRVLVGAPVESVRRETSGAWRVAGGGVERVASRVVLAVPPPAAARLLADVDADAARLAGGVATAPVAVVHLGGRLDATTPSPEGFGVLVPRDAGLDVLGIVFTSSLFPERAPAGSWLQATFLGGATNPGLVEEDDAGLRARAASQTRRVLGFDADRGLARVIRHRVGIPQLERGHAERIRTLRGRVARIGGLALAGNWLDGVSLDHAIASGHAAAAEVAA